MSAKTIDMTAYPRKEHFQHFLDMAYPFITMTVQVDISDWLQRLKQAGYPLFLCFQYAVSRAANLVPEFRQRIRGEGIVEYDFCNPSYTVALPDGTYRYCMVNANQPLEDYLAEARVKQERALQAQHLQEEGDVESLLFTSCVPWVYFSGSTMPFPHTRFSIPNVVWGKYRTETVLGLVEGQVVQQERTTIPVVVFVNHALIDGRHIAAFYSALEEQLSTMTFQPQASRRGEELAV